MSSEKGGGGVQSLRDKMAPFYTVNQLFVLKASLWKGDSFEREQLGVAHFCVTKEGGRVFKKITDFYVTHFMNGP